MTGKNFFDWAKDHYQRVEQVACDTGFSLQTIRIWFKQRELRRDQLLILSALGCEKAVNELKKETFFKKAE